MKKIISTELLKKYDLWLWDWDDTIIDTTTYYIKSMEPTDISRRTNKELDKEVPNWRYFKLLIPYLVKNGVRVGIVSFGTYKIIRAYMNLIFGINQRYFTESNLIALCRDAKGAPIEFYPNKNNFIEKIMNLYKLYEYDRVILFDDRMTNISDAIKSGIHGIKIIGKDNNKLNEYIKSGRCNDYFLDTLFSQKTIMNLEKSINHQNHITNYIKTINQDNNYNYDSKKNIYKQNQIKMKNIKYYKNGQMGQLGTRKMKYYSNSNTELDKEQDLVDTLGDTIIEQPNNTSLFGETKTYKKFVRPEFEYLKRNPEKRCPHKFELFTNNNSKGIIQNNKKIHNLQLKTNLTKHKLQKHKKSFLLFFICSLLFCLYLSKKK